MRKRGSPSEPRHTLIQKSWALKAKASAQENASSNATL